MFDSQRETLMISNAIVVWALIACTVLLATAAAIPVVIPPLTRAWRKATAPGRSVFFIAVLCAMLYAGTKTNQVDQTSRTNEVEMVGGCGQSNLMLRSTSPLTFASDTTPVTPEDIVYGWQRLGPFTNDTLVYTMPEDAVLATNWWLRGAFEDVTRVSNLWAYSWGKVRFALTDTNEIVAVGAPMSAIPFSSRLWSAADTNGAFRITWENFVLGRSNSLVSAQVELRANGDYVTRSNELETVWRHIDPNDFDGDGYLNIDDWDPFSWNDGADDYYGPYNDLPWNCNEDAYCDITVEIGGDRSQPVTFTGDGESDYYDPFFLAKPGVPYNVKILIGKTYRVACDAPIRAVGKSDDEIVVSDIATNAFTVVWPVTIAEAQRLFAAPAAGLLGGSHGNTGFQMTVVPACLDGVFYWSSNNCCQIVNNGDWYSFTCEDDCKCGGCEISGIYAYEGYELEFGGINCGCHYTPHSGTHWGITTPNVVFKDGALRPLEITFHHGNSADPEEGELKLEVIHGSNKIRLWEDADKTMEATTLSWGVSSFDGCTYYVEGIEASDSVSDIEFELTWERPGGTSVTQTDVMTCAEVNETQVDSPTAGITDGSSNPQPFAGHTNWNFNVTHSPHPDKHYAVLFRDVVNDDFSVRDFSVRMTLDVHPAGAPVGRASWFALDPTPDSGAIVSTSARIGELRNPKVGGVYHIGSCFDGSPTNECNIVLPLAGAEMEGVLRNDLVAADAFVLRSKTNFPRRWYERVWFGWKWFCRDDYGFYRGRPNNPQHPTVRSYNQVRDSDGKGAIGTLHGVPIHIEKLSNLIVAYACRKLGVTETETSIASHFGTPNDALANLSWESGEILADGRSFDDEIDFLSVQARTLGSDKSEKLWPNLAPTTNHRETSGHDNFDTEFLSPGFLYAYP